MSVTRARSEKTLIVMKITKELRSERLILRELCRSLAYVREELSVGDVELRVVVAFSGGPDSQVLLHALRQLACAEGLRLLVCHVNHGLRAESAAEEQAVCALVRECLRLPLDVRQAPQRPAEENIESWARAIRYRLLEEVRREQNAHVIATAHHEQDQAETLLFRVLSGRLARSAQSIASFDRERRLVRPLLYAAKEEIDAYLALHNLDFVTDSSNADLRRSRNLIRRDLLPLLKKRVNPNIIRGLAVCAARLNEDEAMIWDEVRRVFAACPPGDFARWLTSYPVPYRWRLVCLLAQKQLGDDALKLGYAQLRRAAELISSAASEERCLNLGFGISCHIRREDEVCFVRETLPEAVRRQPTARDSGTLGVPGELQFQFTPALRTSLTARLVELAPGRADELIEQVRVHGRGSLRHAKCFFDRRTLNAESLTVRFFQPGDAMDVWRRGRRKVKKLFQEQAVAPYLRCAVPIVEFAGRIIWVPGIARSNAAPLRRDTQSVLELEFRELD